MDHRGLRGRLAGAGCTSCGAAIDADAVIVLAHRGDVLFAETSCRACGRRTLAVVIGNSSPEARPGGWPGPGSDPADHGRPAPPPALAEADVAAMRHFLEGWSGDLRSLLGGAGR